MFHHLQVHFAYDIKDFYELHNSVLWEVQWPNGECAGLRIEEPRVPALAEALSCVLGQGTLLSQCPLHPGVLMGTGKFTAGGNPAMD